MFNSKKLALSGLALTGVMAAGAVVAGSATLNWEGVAPGSTSLGEGIVITGDGQDTSAMAFNGTLTMLSNGTFQSSAIGVEVWEEDADKPGEIKAGVSLGSVKATWKLMGTTVKVDSITNTAVTPTVSLNGTAMTVGTASAAISEGDISVASSTEYDFTPGATVIISAHFDVTKA